VTLVVAGAAPSDAGADDVPGLVARVHDLVAAGARLKDAVAQVAAGSGIAKRDLYDAAVQRPAAAPEPAVRARRPRAQPPS
jgi:16S rRNA (cytidine1402-2'-O)-methyltransferase